MNPLHSVFRPAVLLLVWSAFPFNLAAQEAGELETLKAELTEAKTMLRQSFEKNKQLSDQNQAYEAKVVKMIVQIAEKDREIQQYAQKLAQAMEDVYKTQAEVPESTGEAEEQELKDRAQEDLERQLAEAEGERDRLKERAEDLRLENEKLQSQTKGHAAELEKILKQVGLAETRAETEKKSLETRAVTAEKKLEEVRYDADQKEERIRGLENQLRELQKDGDLSGRLRELEEELRGREDRIRELEDLQAADQRQIESLRESQKPPDVEAAPEKTSESSEEVRRLESRIQVLEQSKRIAEDEVATLQSQLRRSQSELRQEIVKLREEKEEVEKTLQGLQSKTRENPEPSSKRPEAPVRSGSGLEEDTANELGKAVADLVARDKMIEDARYAQSLLEVKNVGLQKELDRKEVRIRELEGELKQQITEVRGMNQALNEEVRERGGQMTDLRLKLRASEDTIRDLEKKLGRASGSESRDAEKTRESRPNPSGKGTGSIQKLETGRLRDQVTYLYNLGTAYAEQGLFKDAARMFEEALARDPLDASAHYNLGILYDDHLNQPEKAIRHYDAFLSLGRDPEKLRQVSIWKQFAESYGGTGGRESRARSAREAFEKLLLTSPYN